MRYYIPNIRGIRSVRTRFPSNCLFGTKTPNPSAKNFEIENGT